MSDIQEIAFLDLVGLHEELEKKLRTARFVGERFAGGLGALQRFWRTPWAVPCNALPQAGGELGQWQWLNGPGLFTNKGLAANSSISLDGTEVANALWFIRGHAVVWKGSTT